MKDQLIYITSIILGVCFLSSCAKEDFSADDFLSPTIFLWAPIVQANGVILLKCSVKHNGAIVPSYGFEYGIDEDLDDSEEVKARLKDDYFYAEVSNVTSREKYYYRAYIKNERNTITTKIETFHTSKILPVEIDAIRWAVSNVRGDNGYNDGSDSWYYTWSQAISACPDDWRLPTKDEFKKLLNTGATWKDSETNTTPGNKAGRWIGNNHSRATVTNPGRAVFFPASGYRNTIVGNLTFVDSYGSYWTSTSIDNEDVWCLHFTNMTNVRMDSKVKDYGRSVRCVEE